MKTFASTHSHTRNTAPVREHTPIYDLAAYKEQQRKQRQQQLLKNVLDGSVFLSMSMLVLSFFFWAI